MTTRHIIFIPGTNPKPRAEEHRALLWRTLLEGVRRVDAETAQHLQAHPAQFHLVSWNNLFYHEQKDIGMDQPWVEALLSKPKPSEQDILDANGLGNKMRQAVVRVVDRVPFLLRFLSKPTHKILLDIERYFNDTEQVASQIRNLLKQVLLPLLEKNEPVLIIGHSMGSVIAYDTLWEMSQKNIAGQQDGLSKLDFLTLGSPLGMRIIQKKLLGRQGIGKISFPSNIRRWNNVAAEGDIVALNGNFKHSFKEMLNREMVETIEDYDHGVYNFFRNEVGLNSHRSYGYLVNPVVGRLIAAWWRASTNKN